MKKNWKLKFNTGEIIFPNNIINFSVKIRGKNNVKMVMQSYNYMEISAPEWVEKSFIENVINENMDKILIQNENMKVKNSDINEGETVYIIGKKYYVHIENGDNYVVFENELPGSKPPGIGLLPFSASRGGVSNPIQPNELPGSKPPGIGLLPFSASRGGVSNPIQPNELPLINGLDVISKSLHDDQLIIKCNGEQKIKSILFDFYTQICLEMVKVRITYFGKLMNIKFNKIYIKDVKTFWGCCAGNGNISFNYKIIMFDQKIIDYIIIHELSHIVHLNHSKEFWSLVEKYEPDYKILRNKMKHSAHITGKF